MKPHTQNTHTRVNLGSLRAYYSILSCIYIWSVCIGCSPPKEDKIPLLIFAASSLTETFQECERTFEAQHPNIDVRFVFSGSQSLRLQIEQGAQADLFASANPHHLQHLTRLHLVSEPHTIAHNTLALVVPQNNPANIQDFTQLPQAKKIVLGTEFVPIGMYTKQLFQNAQTHLGDSFVESVQQRVVSLEPNTRLVRAKVALGEADAAIVYATDLHSTHSLLQIPIPNHLQVHTETRIATLTHSPNPTAAQLWIRFLHSKPARTIFHTQGFQTPPL